MLKCNSKLKESDRFSQRWLSEWHVPLGLHVKIFSVSTSPTCIPLYISLQCLMPFNEVDTALSCGVIPVSVAGNGHCNFKNWFIAILSGLICHDQALHHLFVSHCNWNQTTLSDCRQVKALSLSKRKSFVCVRLCVCRKVAGKRPKGYNVSRRVILRSSGLCAFKKNSLWSNFEGWCVFYTSAK